MEKPDATYKKFKYQPTAAKVMVRHFWNSKGPIPYLRVFQPHFFDKNLPSKMWVRLIHGILKNRSSKKKPLSYRRLSP
jgi:hypothetical protein